MRKQEEEEERGKTLGSGSSHIAGNEWGRRRWAGLFVKGWVWVPPSLKLVGIKTSVSGPRMQSTKKRKMFLIKSIFQKV